MSSFDELSAALRTSLAIDSYQPAVGHDDRGPVWVFARLSGPMGTELLVAEPVFAATVAAMEPVTLGSQGFRRP